VSEPQVTVIDQTTDNPLASKIRAAFQRASAADGKLLPELLAMTGMSGKKFRVFLNNLIGAWRMPATSKLAPSPDQRSVRQSTAIVCALSRSTTGERHQAARHCQFAGRYRNLSFVVIPLGFEQLAGTSIAGHEADIEFSDSSRDGTPRWKREIIDAGQRPSCRSFAACS
jgi:hypothetical protein